MKNLVRAMAAVAVLLGAGKAYPQAPTPSFSLHVDVSPSSATAGSELQLIVDLTNNRPEELVMLVELGTTVQDNFAIHVRDSHGNSVPGPKPLPYDETAYVGIMPGKTMKFQGDLSRMFDLSHPDRYEIQVEREDLDTHKSVKSNVGHVVITAQ